MLEATYDTDSDGQIDVAAGGTEKASWTQYCIPYLSGATAFGEIAIGTAGQLLKVSVGATGYEWFSPAYLEDITSESILDLDDTPAAFDNTKFLKSGAAACTWESLTEADITDLGTYLENIAEDTTPELGGEMDCGAHSIGFTLQTVAEGDGTTTFDFKLGNHVKFTFGAQNETFTFTAPSNPCHMTLVLVQDAVGSRTVTWPVTVKWVGGTAPTLTTDANGVDVIGLFWDGTNYFAAASLDFSVPA
jgi:hypothetical protein